MEGVSLKTSPGTEIPVWYDPNNPRCVIITEDRDLFVKELNKVDLKVPVSHACENMEEAVAAAEASWPGPSTARTEARAEP